jgi:ABC-type lipoprotein release transport system permease subunit
MIPLRYNYRNLVVRWKTTLLTATGFTLVVTLLVVMLAFIQGLEAMAASAGRPGNVIILRDGANDELFSDINVADVHNKLYELLYRSRAIVGLDVGDPWISMEVYSIATQELPPDEPGGRPRFRFLQIRGVEEPEVAGAVHDLTLKPGGRWFSRSGKECVMGEGIARTLGLDVGGTFRPRPDLEWEVVGIMASGGSPFNSEIWAKREEVGRYFGKDNAETQQSFFTSITVTTPNHATARQVAAYLRNLNEIKVHALPERDYYEELSKSNQMFHGTALVIALFMAVGGVFGLMNTMFAAVSQRVKDIGVLRILGYGRRQILVSFLLESLLIAAVGGGLGLLAGSACHGLELTGQMSSGQGSGKTVVFRMIVNQLVLAAGAVFTLGMGLLGGLVPAWSAMRLRPLEALR